MERRAAVERHHILVGSDVGVNEHLLCHLAGEFRETGAQIHKDAVVVCAAAHNLVALCNHSLRHSLGILLHLLLIVFVFRLQSLAESHSLGGNHMLKRTALNTREHRRVENSRHLLHNALRCRFAPWILEILAEQNQAAARTAESLVGSRCHDMRIFQRIVEQSGSDKSGRVSHVDHQQRAYFIGNLTHTCIIPLA